MLMLETMHVWSVAHIEYPQAVGVPWLFWCVHTGSLRHSFRSELVIAQVGPVWGRLGRAAVQRVPRARTKSASSSRATRPSSGRVYRRRPYFGKARYRRPFGPGRLGHFGANLVLWRGCRGSSGITYCTVSV